MVYLIVVYDVQADRTARLRKPLRQYLTHVQNSVFEGRITAGQADDLESLIRDRVRDSEGESAIIYQLGSEAVINRVAVGEDPSEDEQFL